MISKKKSRGKTGSSITGQDPTTILSFMGKPKERGPATELSLEEFECFVTQTLSKHVEASSASLRQLHRCLELNNFRETLTEMEMGLLSLLKSHPSLPTTVVAQLHTYLGLIYMEQNKNKSAVDSFMRAIWFQSRTPEDTFAIAQANHRLGMAYAGRKEYEQARDLLDRAIAGYDSASEDYLAAKEDRHAIQEAEQLELLTKNKAYTIRPDMEQTVAQNQRVSRRNRVQQKQQQQHSKSPTRRRTARRNQSFGSATEAFKNKNKATAAPSFQRQATAPSGSILSRSTTAQTTVQAVTPSPPSCGLPGLSRSLTCPPLAADDDQHNSTAPTQTAAVRGRVARKRRDGPRFQRTETSPVPIRASRL